MTIVSLRKYKLFGMTLFDLIIALVGMIIIFLIMWYWHFRQLKWWNFVIAAILLTIPTGIVFHVIFGVNTELNSKLGLSGKPKP